MKIPLSNRLLACCGYVKPGDRVADVGCDHGYLGIYLLKNGIASAVIASDVREMPLQSAIRNAEKFGVKERMAFYLSDGIRDVRDDLGDVLGRRLLRGRDAQAFFTEVAFDEVNRRTLDAGAADVDTEDGTFCHATNPSG